MSVLGLESGYTVKYGLSPRYFPRRTYWSVLMTKDTAGHIVSHSDTEPPLGTLGTSCKKI